MLLSILQDIDIDEKIKNAPNDDYSTGVLIGSMIPFIVFVLIAYAIYRYNKKRMDKDFDL